MITAHLQIDPPFFKALQNNLVMSFMIRAFIVSLGSIPSSWDVYAWCWTPGPSLMSPCPLKCQFIPCGAATPVSHHPIFNWGCLYHWLSFALPPLSAEEWEGDRRETALSRGRQTADCSKRWEKRSVALPLTSISPFLIRDLVRNGFVRAAWQNLRDSIIPFLRKGEI